jgi:acyl-CoA thioester hydrolase
LPEKGVFHFTFTIPVRYSDLDAQGHLNHARYFSFMEEARFQYMLALGLWRPTQSFDDVGQIVAEAACAYKAPVFVNQSVTVAVRTASIGNKSMTLEYEMRVGETVVGTGRTVQVAYDYAAHRSRPVPAEWREKIRAFEGRELA